MTYSWRLVVFLGGFWVFFFIFLPPSAPAGPDLGHAGVAAARERRTHLYQNRPPCPVTHPQFLFPRGKTPGPCNEHAPSFPGQGCAREQRCVITVSGHRCARVHGNPPTDGPGARLRPGDWLRPQTPHYPINKLSADPRRAPRA